MKRLLGVAFAGLFMVATVHAADVAGKKVFVAKCAMCHGLDAKGKPAMAKAKKVELSAMDLTQADVAKKDLAKIMTEGTGKMAGVKGLSPADVAAVTAYLKTLGAAPAAPKADAKKN